MPFVRPDSVAEAAAALGAHPDWLVIAGGTDVEVAINFGHREACGVVALRGDSMSGVERRGTDIFVGATTTFADIGAHADRDFVGLAAAARTVGSPQLRTMATLGGNLGTASPAGDAHPVLLACAATVHLYSVARGARAVPVDEYFLAPGKSAKSADEIISGVSFRSGDTSQRFFKVGTRNAMVISVASAAAVIDWHAATVRIAMGSVGPTPLRAPTAERFLMEVLWPDVERATSVLLEDPGNGLSEFAALVAADARPITDHRGTAEYRRTVVGRVAARCVESMLRDRRDAGVMTR